MAFMIVPRVVTTSSAELWIGADNESADLDDSPVLLRTELGDRSIAGAWSVLGALGGGHFLRYKSVTLDGLRPGQRYTPTLLLGGAATAVATATVFTLPERLPTILDPFITSAPPRRAVATPATSRAAASSSIRAPRPYATWSRAGLPAVRSDPGTAPEIDGDGRRAALPAARLGRSARADSTRAL